MLADRVALVTGGARNIGAAIARSMSQAGACVAIGDLVDSADHFSIALDVSDEASVIDAVAATVKRFGRLDILVNNAGIMFECHITEQDRPSWDKMLAVNLTGPMLMTKHAAEHLAKSGSGAVVNIGSLEGAACNPSHAAYAAAKAGIAGLTRATAIDLGPSGIRCNAIAPGWIDTPLNSSYVDDHPERGVVIAELARLHPLGRVGYPADVAEVATWLSSDQASFLTGQVITVDGGRAARPPLPSGLW